MEVIRHKIVIAVIANGRNHALEVVHAAKSAAVNSIKDLVETGVGLVVAVCVVVAEVVYIFGQVAKQEDVFFANFSSDFDLGMSVQLPV